MYAPTLYSLNSEIPFCVGLVLLKNEKMKYAFLILNYKSYKDTIKLCDEIYRDGYDDYMIVVVDNSSPNESRTVLSEYAQTHDNLAFIESEKNEGYAKGNNYGLHYLKSYSPDYVCILNNDVHFTRQVIEHLAEVYEALPDAGAISPRQLLPNGSYAKYTNLDHPTFLSDVLSYTPFSRRQHKYECNTIYNNVQKVAIVPGAFVFTKYSRFEEVGFFYDQTFLFCEERFTARRFAEKGYSNYLLLDCTYLHEHSKTIKANVKGNTQRKYVLDGKLKYTRTYRSFPTLKCAIINFFYKLEEWSQRLR